MNYADTVFVLDAFGGWITQLYAIFKWFIPVVCDYNIKRYRVGKSKHNTLLRCKVLQGRRHVSALYYKAIIRSDMVKTKEENYNVTYSLYTQYAMTKRWVLNKIWFV